MFQQNHEKKPLKFEKTEYLSATACNQASQAKNLTLMEWSVSTISASPKKTMQAQIYIIATFTLIFLYVLWLTWDNLSESASSLIAAGATLAIFAIYSIVLGVRQKTVFEYKIYKEGGHLEYFLFYPDFANWIFKITPILTILLFVSVAIYTKSLLFLIGPVAIALGSARFLLGWKNEVHTRKSTPWNEYNFVTIDKNRLMVITHITDPTLGFEARFPNKELLDQYLCTIKSLLPGTAEYIEKKWEW